MSGRPQIPTISVNTTLKDNVNGRRVSTDSSHARTPDMYSHALTDSLSWRASKRPSESQSYSESPPDKRSRPPEPRSASQDRLESTQHQKCHDVRVPSPSSIENGASTPTSHAPLAPSMLPVADLSTLRRSPVVISSAIDNTPITMQSLRKLKERKRVIAHQMTASVGKTIEAKLVAQGMDIAYLKGERDRMIRDRDTGLEGLKKQLEEDLKKQLEVDLKKKLEEGLKKQLEEGLDETKRSLDEVKAKSAHFPNLMDRAETPELVNVAIKPLTDRLGVLEQSAAKLPYVQEVMDEMHQRIDELKEKEDKLFHKVDAIREDIMATNKNVSKLEKDFSNHQEDIIKYIGRIEDDFKDTGASLSKRVAALRTTVAPLAQPDVNALNDIQRDLETLFKNSETHDVTISSLSEYIPNLFNDHFDPFRTHVAEQIRAISNTLEKYGSDLSNLMQQDQLGTMMTEVVTLKTDFAALKSSLSTKADTAEMNQELEGITFALNNLQSRYDNISTDDIYKRMVVWFTQMYPSFTQISEDISQLKGWVDGHSNVINDLSHNAEHLNSLVSVAPQLRSLADRSLQPQPVVNRATALGQPVAEASQLQSHVDSDKSPFARAHAMESLVPRIQKSVEDLQRAFQTFQTEAADQQSANLKTMQGLRLNVYSDRSKCEVLECEMKNLLNRLRQTVESDKASFAKAEELHAFKKTLEDLQSKINRTETAHSADMKKLGASVTTDACKISILEMETKNYFKELEQFRRDYDAAVPKIWRQLSHVQGAGTELCKELDVAVKTFDDTVNTYIEPNRDFFGLFGTAIIVISQLQQVVERLNQNLPVAPLKLEWQCYLPTLGQPETDGGTNGEPSNWKGKGKGRQ